MQILTRLLSRPSPFSLHNRAVPRTPSRLLHPLSLPTLSFSSPPDRTCIEIGTYPGNLSLAKLRGFIYLCGSLAALCSVAFGTAPHVGSSLACFVLLPHVALVPLRLTRCEKGANTGDRSDDDDYDDGIMVTMTDIAWFT